ncbi:disease resistance protein Roq1-like [Nymphaea colorata]|uniref:disease resistance protein Roq1-like n=1 Tax=Nymphaea colorata TaxID=210225 RepID=UPI00129DB7D5|nr:disease resistance protein Roq1-like [Nymphaea colorata]
MVIFAALFIVLFITVLFGHVFLQRIKDFLQFSANQNGSGGIRGRNMEAGEEERGITTFIDCEKLEKGEEINKLLEYIDRSKIVVPIFSKRFAESKWCLKEVTKSVECGKEIIPVFFGVEPSDVCNQGGPFKSAFKDHQSNKEQDQEEVMEWREALKKVEISLASLSRT